MRLVVGGGAVLLSLLTLGGCGASLDSTIKKYGYNPIRPPSTLLVPGTIVRILGQNPLRVGIVCTRKAALGNDTPKLSSDTASTELTEKVKREFKLDANYLDQVRANAGTNAIRNVSLKLINPTVHAVSDDEIEAGLTSRSSACKSAIERRLGEGARLAMISSALKADVSYVVEFESSASLSAEAKLKAMKGIETSLSAKAETSGTTTLTGSQLYWGVVEDLFRKSRRGVTSFFRALISEDKDAVPLRFDKATHLMKLEGAPDAVE